MLPSYLNVAFVHELNPENGEEYAIHITPIVDENNVLSDEELSSYIDELIDGAVNKSDILECDKTKKGGLGILLGVHMREDGLMDGDFMSSFFTQADQFKSR